MDEVIIWKDIHFKQVDPHKGELLRYESSPGYRQPYPIILWKWNSKQWGAMFPGGTYSVEDNMEDALLSAARKSIDMMYYSIAMVENLMYDYGP